MKTGFNNNFWKIFVALSLLTLIEPVFAVGSYIAGQLLLTGFTAAATAFAINMVVSAIITKAFFSPEQPGGLSGDSQNPGNRQQVPPATDNKLPIVYGQAWLGGTIVDLSISSNNQELYYVIAICEVTNNGNDTITFGDVYWGGKKVNFASASSPDVVSLTDESTSTVDTSVNGKLQIFMYRNGSNVPVRGSQTAIQVMQTAGLTYTWDSSKLMTNCAFAIVHITYNTDAGLTGIQQTKFQVTNSRSAPGDCIYDYLTNTVYGGAIDVAQIDTASLTALNTYSAQLFAYNPYGGGSATQARFRFDGVLDTNRSIMDNLQDMASCCDCLIRYNEITSQWGVIVQSPTYSIAMALDDSNIISSIQVTPLDIAASYNVIECKFPDKSNQDSFNSTTFDLNQIAPSLLYPNEPVNKQSVSLPLVNDNVRAQYLAIRMLKGSREDLQLQLSINYQGIQLEAGDIVTVTNANYGWVAKEFRVMKVTEDFGSDGSITAKLLLAEFNPAVYNDVTITQFTPSPNTGIPDPLIFGSIPAPTVGSQFPTADNPLFIVNITASAQGIIQYAELWYSAFSNPTATQRIFAGTTEIRSNGLPYPPGTAMPGISLSNIPAGTWYFFSRMVNSLGTSSFSPASSPFVWKPTTFQYSERYLSVAYADNVTGTSNFNLSPTNRLYYGLYNTSSSSVSTNPADYTWYLADPTLGTNRFLCYANRTSRKFSFATGFADYAAGSGEFVPTQAIIFDPRLWSALPNGTNIIDLDYATGQVLETGTTTVGAGEIEVTNNPDGKVVASLKQFLDFGPGVLQYTGTASTLTIDIYGRVVGFVPPDDFNYTSSQFTATAGQTVFTVTRASSYISGQCLVFQNGVLLDETEYIDTGGATGTVTLGTAASLNDRITIISFRSSSSTNVATTGASGTGSVATLTFAAKPYPPFNVGATITVSGVTPTGYNGDKVVTACTTTSVSFASTTTGAQTVAGTIAYKNNVYPSLTRNTATLTNASAYTASGFTLNSGYELLFLNGTIVNEQDYDIVGQTITNFPSVSSGLLTIIQWQPNNLGTPNGDPANVVQYTVVGQSTYSFSYQANAFNLYSNGALQVQGSDYTTGTGNYVLSSVPDNNSTIMVQQVFARTGAV